MNRLISVNLNDVRPEVLPPLERQGRTRALFISTVFMGFHEYYQRLVHYSAQRDDMDAVHIEVRFPLWNKILGKSMPFGTRGWDMHSYRYLLIWRWLLRRWLRGPLDIRRFDVVHIMTQVIAMGFLDVKPRCSARFAINIDGTATQDCTDFDCSWIARAPFVAAERRMFGAADLIVCRNAWAAGSLREHYGVPEDRIHVAKNSMFAPEASRQDHPPVPPGGKVKMVFVGNAWRRKGGPRLLEIHQRRFADRVEMHVCGGRIRPDHSARNVIWHGRVPRDELINRLLPTMDIFVMPTRMDMHPWAILEAASAGLAVVTSRQAGIPEMIIDGHTGLLCEVGDWAGVEKAIARLVEDAALRDRLGRAARAHVKASYNPDRTYQALMDRLVGLQERVVLAT